MHDRLKPMVRSNMQAGFITVLVLPLWAHLAEPLFARVVDVSEVLASLRRNLARWTAQIQHAAADATGEAPIVQADGT